MSDSEPSQQTPDDELSEPRPTTSPDADTELAIDPDELLLDATGPLAGAIMDDPEGTAGAVDDVL
jgi:hypothetical protein